jgi:hypothetical protein
MMGYGTENMFGDCLLCSCIYLFGFLMCVGTSGFWTMETGFQTNGTATTNTNLLIYTLHLTSARLFPEDFYEFHENLPYFSPDTTSLTAPYDTIFPSTFSVKQTEILPLTTRSDPQSATFQQRLYRFLHFTSGSGPCHGT